MRTMKWFACATPLLGVFLVNHAYADVTDPAAAIPPLRYESVFADYRAQQEPALLPWKDLFTTDGEFATATAPATPTQLAQATAPLASPSPASDTRGRIESINLTENKVKLKHGPITKFDMPGMTMVFRVQDPKLLTQIKVGDEVGVTLEKSGSAFVITGFQK